MQRGAHATAGNPSTRGGYAGGGACIALACVVLVFAACRRVPIWGPDTSTSTGWLDGSVRQQPVDKVDLLFMIDGSPGMGDKQALLAEAVPLLVDRLLHPSCIDSVGHVVGKVDQDGWCARGRAQFSPVHDMHIGVVTSSLGGRGGDPCDRRSGFPPTPQGTRPNPHADDQGHLVNRAGADGHAVADASPSNFLAWFPGAWENEGKPPPPVPAIGDEQRLAGDVADLIGGVGEDGCFFEAQNEAWYRFLVQPDPFASIEKNAARAVLSGIDATILRQRRDFLRPDSLLAVIVVTDDDEKVVDPLGAGGQGWAFENSTFPGSPSGAAPQATVECRSNPTDPSCTSCALIQNDPSFGQRCPGGAYLDPSDDRLDVRFFHQKQRFGLLAGYPTSRYIDGLTKRKVPSRDNEHDKSGNYAPNANCINPIYATKLPTDPNGELCNLQPGPRTPDLVYYAAIAGVPHELLQDPNKDPNDPSSIVDPTTLSATTKPTLKDFWDPITGANPEQYDFTGADFHMLESETARAGSSCSPSSADSCDPIDGREWDTGKQDLQFACVFDLPQPRDCNLAHVAGACDCADGSPTRDTPLCEHAPGHPGADARGYTTTQIRAKAHPSVREMWIARQMGAQGIAASVCPIHARETAPGDPLFGYRPAMNAIANRLAGSLSYTCLSWEATPDADGKVPCSVVVALPIPNGGDESACGALGYSVPSERVLAAVRDGVHPICEVHQLTNPRDFDGDGSCAGSSDPGWCVVTGEAANGCPWAIQFTHGQPPSGAEVTVLCGPGT